MGSDKEGGSDNGGEGDNTFDLGQIQDKNQVGNFNEDATVVFGDAGGFAGNAFGNGDAFGLEP